MTGLLKKYTLLLCACCFLACSPFSPLADATVVAPEGSFISVSNPKADVKSLTFGDFEFARNQRELKKIGGNTKGLKAIIFHAKTSQPTYEYCIMYEPKNLNRNNPEFMYIDTLLQGKRLVLAISKSAPASDAAFIRKHIYPFDEASDLKIQK